MTENTETNAASDKAWEEFQAQADELQKESEKRGEMLMTVGSCTDEVEVNAVDDIRKEVQFVTIPQDAASYFKAFTTIASRIGDDIDDFEVLDEVLPVSVSHPNTQALCLLSMNCPLSGRFQLT
jgi:hypothetical protein